jgi:hypothetical protein
LVTQVQLFERTYRDLDSQGIMKRLAPIACHTERLGYKG